MRRDIFYATVVRFHFNIKEFGQHHKKATRWLGNFIIIIIANISVNL